MMAGRVRLPSISFIVARSYPGNVIGFQNKLPWHIKSDLKRFRLITSGHAIIMGRSTFESIGRALPDRANIVVSRSKQLPNQTTLASDNGTQIFWANSLENALFIADIMSICRGQDELFVVGGEAMYSLFDEFVNKVYLTEVFYDFSGDSFFKKRFTLKEWKFIEEHDYPRNYEGDDYPHRFTIRQKRDRKYRSEFVAKYFTEKLEKYEWLKTQVKFYKPKVEQYIQNNLDV
jgi:dihydrofolate reductase